MYLTALLVGTLFALPAGLILIGTITWPDADLIQRNGFYLGSDFVNYWTGGRLALEGRVGLVYDLAGYYRLVCEWFVPQVRLMNFSYPPHALLLLAIAGAFPYFVALALWSLAGVAGFVVAALGLAPHRADRRLLFAVILAPIVWNNLAFGQFGLLLAASFVGALRALPARPILAGVLMGFLTIKPQLGLLLPLLLLLTGAWRTIAAAVVTTLALVALSAALFGVEPWRVYVAETMPFQWHFVEVMDGFYRFQMTSPYAALWFLGVPVGVAVALQGAIALAVAVTACAVARSDASWPLKAAVFACGSVLTVPYILSYDLAIPLAALVWYLRDGEVRESALGAALVGTVWALPYALGIMVQTRGLPLLPLVLMVYYAWLVKEALAWSWMGRPAPVSAKA